MQAASTATDVERGFDLHLPLQGNEMDLALDVYRQMLAEGCTPNLVTYNTLIDVYVSGFRPLNRMPALPEAFGRHLCWHAMHASTASLLPHSFYRTTFLRLQGKTGAWEEAIAVLDALEAQGIEPEIRTYNTGEGLCVHWYALGYALLQVGCKAMANPGPCAFSAVLLTPAPAAPLPSPCPSHHRVQHERAGAGGAAHLRAHAAGGGAAHRHHLHRPHLRLRQERPAGQGAADLPGGRLHCCCWCAQLAQFVGRRFPPRMQPGRGWHAGHALSLGPPWQAHTHQPAHPSAPAHLCPLPQDMVRRGCERNVITYSSLISACEKAGRWELALELFREMHTEGCRPNVVTYNSLIAACAQGEEAARCAALWCAAFASELCCASELCWRGKWSCPDWHEGASTLPSNNITTGAALV